MLGARRLGLGSGRGPGFLPSGRRSSGWAPAVVRGKPSEPSASRTRWNTFTTHLSIEERVRVDRRDKICGPSTGRPVCVDRRDEIRGPSTGRPVCVDRRTEIRGPSTGRPVCVDCYFLNGNSSSTVPLSNLSWRAIFLLSAL